MSTKRLLCLIVAMVLLLGIIAGCGTGKEPDKTDPADPGDKEVVDKDKDKEDEDEPSTSDREIITVSMNVMDAEKNGNNPKMDYVKEKFGLEFEYWPVNWGDWNEKINNWISVNDTPDLIWWDLKGAQSNQYKTWAKQGAFKPIPYDLIAKYPNLQDRVDNMESFKHLEVDGELYAWPSSRRYDPMVKNTYSSVWIYRRDWAKAVGLYNEDDIYEWEEWKNLIKTVIEKDPGGNGAGNTAGLVMPPWAFPHAPVLFIGSVPAEGNETCAYIKVDGEWVWPPTLDSYKEEVVETWQMYQDGLIWKDNMGFSGGEDEELFKAGRAFARYQGGVGVYNDFSKEMLENGVIEKDTDMGPAIVKDRNGDVWLTQTEDYWTVTAFSNKVDDEKMDRILEFWDFLNSEEGLLFNELGFEGKDYEIDANGEVKVLWEIDPETNRYVSPYADYAFGAFTPATLVPEINHTAMEFGINEHISLYEKLNKLNFKVKPVNYDMAFFSAPEKDKYGNFGMDAKTKLSEIIANPNADPAAEWEAWVESMMPRVQPILDELNEGLK